jgi:hypothetical protein
VPSGAGSKTGAASIAAPRAARAPGGDDPPIGFRALRFHGAPQPALLLHGHVHPHGVPPANMARLDRRANVVGRHLLEIEPGADVQNSPRGHSHAR